MSNPLIRDYFRPSVQIKAHGFCRFFLIMLIFSLLPVSQPVATPLELLAIERADGETVHYRVEIADEAESRSAGLMHRDDLPAGNGMLFDYREPRSVQMWMKNTHIPLDMLFIDAGGYIVHIVEHTRPLSREIIDSTQPVRAVLEVNAGSSARHGLRVGDRVRHRIFSNAERYDAR